MNLDDFPGASEFEAEQMESILQEQRVKLLALLMERLVDLLSAAPYGWGLWDTQENVWLGNGAAKKGPNVYTDFDMARAGATVATLMLQYRLGRIRAVPFIPDELVFVGSNESVFTAQEIFEQIQKGETKCR
jgi:hypothetical protein